MTMKRSSRRIPGHDCVRHPCGKNGCGTSSSHGIHNEEWEYLIKDAEGEVALSLYVGSGLYPESVPKQDEPNKPCAYVISLHVGFPITRDQVAGRLENTTSCDHVRSGRCCQGTEWHGYRFASDFSEKHFVHHAGFEQPESFWKALEAQFTEWSTEAYAQRADTKYTRCMHCDGTGTVAR